MNSHWISLTVACFSVLSIAVAISQQVLIEADAKWKDLSFRFRIDGRSRRLTEKKEEV